MITAILLISGFADYMASGSDAAYQQLCSEITVEFNDCSKQVTSCSSIIFSFASFTTGLQGHMSNISSQIAQVLEMESLFMSPEYGREDLAHLLRSVQIKEKQKLNLVPLSSYSLASVLFLNYQAEIFC